MVCRVSSAVSVVYDRASYLLGQCRRPREAMPFPLSRWLKTEYAACLLSSTSSRLQTQTEVQDKVGYTY
eukprot:3578387-Prymnesium_polylepis.1